MNLSSVSGVRGDDDGDGGDPAAVAQLRLRRRGQRRPRRAALRREAGDLRLDLHQLRGLHLLQGGLPHAQGGLQEEAGECGINTEIHPLNQLYEKRYSCIINCSLP